MSRKGRDSATARYGAMAVAIALIVIVVIPGIFLAVRIFVPGGVQATDYIMNFWHGSGQSGNTQGPGWNQGTPIFEGSTKLTMPTKTPDETSKTTNEPTLIVFHCKSDGSIDLGQRGQSDDGTNNYIIDQVYPADKGFLWVVADTGTGTTYFVDAELTDALSTVVVAHMPIDWNAKGKYKEAFKLDLRGFSKPSSGDLTVTITVYVWAYRASSNLSGTATLNPTAVSTTAVAEYTAKGYMTSWSAAMDAIKIIKVELTLPDAGNASYSNAGGGVTLRKIVLGNGKPINVNGVEYRGAIVLTKFTWDLANKKYVSDDLNVADLSQEYYGKFITYSTGSTSTFFTYEVTIEAQFPLASKVWYPTLSITPIKPTSIGDTAISAVMSFTS